MRSRTRLKGSRTRRGAVCAAAWLAALGPAWAVDLDAPNLRGPDLSADAPQLDLRGPDGNGAAAGGMAPPPGALSGLSPSARRPPPARPPREPAPPPPAETAARSDRAPLSVLDGPAPARAGRPSALSAPIRASMAAEGDPFSLLADLDLDAPTDDATIGSIPLNPGRDEPAMVEGFGLSGPDRAVGGFVPYVPRARGSLTVLGAGFGAGGNPRASTTVLGVR